MISFQNALVHDRNQLANVFPNGSTGEQVRDEVLLGKVLVYAVFKLRKISKSSRSQLAICTKNGANPMRETSQLNSDYIILLTEFVGNILIGMWLKLGP